MCQVGPLTWIIWLSTVTALRIGPAALQTVDLVITANQSLGDVLIDGQIVVLPNAGNWNLTDHVALPAMSRLIALECLYLKTESCAGVLASVNDTYLLTNKLWKCSSYSYPGWTDLGYDDSGWPDAVEYGSNGNHSNCSQQMHFPDINSNAQWIWSNDLTAFNVYCRGYLPLCQTSSPCLNGGTCLPNEKRMCDCPPQYNGTYCEIDSLATLETTKMTTEMTTHPQTTEGITTSDPQTLPQTTQGVTTETETTHGITTDILQTTDSTTTTATTSATTATTSTTEMTLSIATGTQSTTVLSTTETTDQSSTTAFTTPTVTAPGVSGATTNPQSTTATAAHSTSSHSSTTTVSGHTTVSPTSYTELISSTNPGSLVSSDPPKVLVCTTEDYCNGPLEKPGSSIEHCACPEDFLNVNNNCCMSQNWIIGLTCLCFGIVLLIFIVIIICLCRSDSSHSSVGDSMSLVERHHNLADSRSMDLTYVSETHTENHKKPEGGVVDAHHVTESAHRGPETRRPSVGSAALGVNTQRNTHPSAEHALTQHPIYTLAQRRGQPAHRSMIERGRREDFFYNPLMVDLLSNDIYRHFRPSLAAIPTNVDYSIRRPEIELEFLYNELYGSVLHRGNHDHSSSWNMNTNMRL